jgi:hypothetical protein
VGCPLKTGAHDNLGSPDQSWSLAVSVSRLPRPAARHITRPKCRIARARRHPEPYRWGILFALGAAMSFCATGHQIELQNTTKSGLLPRFFACLGLTSDLRLLLRGGPRLLRFVGAPVVPPNACRFDDRSYVR